MLKVDGAQMGKAFHKFAMEEIGTKTAREIAGLVGISEAEYSNCRHGRKGSLDRFVRYAAILADWRDRPSVVTISDGRVAFTLGPPAVLFAPSEGFKVGMTIVAKFPHIEKLHYAQVLRIVGNEVTHTQGRFDLCVPYEWVPACPECRTPTEATAGARGDGVYRLCPVCLWDGSSWDDGGEE